MSAKLEIPRWQHASFNRYLVPTIKIQYSRPTSDVEFLKKTFGVQIAKAVGERTFDVALKRQRG
jgi:hypothetical protein